MTFKLIIWLQNKKAFLLLFLLLQRFTEIAAKNVETKTQLAVMTECLETMLKKLALPKHVRL